MKRRLTIVAALAMILMGAVVPRTAAAEPVRVTPELLAEFRRDTEAFFFDLRYLETIACARAVMADTAAPPEVRAAACRALGQVYAAMNAPGQARSAFSCLFEQDPHADLDPPAAYPPVVVRAFYAARNAAAHSAAAPPPDAEPGIHTLAVGPMTNGSPALPGMPYDMERFAAGLTQMVISDLSPATSLRIVDRQRLNVLRQEIALSNSGVADPDQAVRAGRLLGAQSYLFGNVTWVPGNIVRIDLRLVETETGRILLAAKKEAKVKNGSDLLKLEAAVVTLLAERLDRAAIDAGAGKGSVLKASERALKARKAQRDEAMKLLELTGAAILAEDAGNLDEAIDYWTEVKSLDAANPLAAARVTALDLGRRYAALELEER